MKKSQEPDVTDVITASVRCTYLFAFRPFKNKDAAEDAKPKYKVTVLFPKDDYNMSRIKKAIKAATEKKFGDRVPKKFRNPLNDGDDHDDENFHGHWYITASSETKPEIFDEEGDPCDDETVIYSGCYAKVYIKAFGYDRAGSRGVGFAFNALHKTKDGERLSGRMSGRQAFGLDKKRDRDDEDEDRPRRRKRREEVDPDDF